VRQVVVLSVALVAALVGAYMAWTDDSEPDDEETAVAIYAAGEGDVSKLAWEGKEHSVLVERRTDAKGPYLWVTATDRKFPKPAKTPDPHDDAHDDESPDEAAPETPAVPPAEPAADAAPAAPEPDPNVPIEEKTSSFMANAQGEEMFATFAPLEAMRELPMTPEEKSAFGFDEPAAKVVVTRRNGEVALTVGGETYGSKDRYVEANSKVWLVDDATLRPLEFAATRLVERSLFPTAEKDVAKVEVQPAAGTPITYVQTHADDAAKAFWAKAETPDKADEAGGTWLDKVFRLKLREYVDEQAVSGPPTSVVTYTVHGTDGVVTRVEILKGETPPPAEGDEAEETPWYARSDYNRGLVALTESLARNVVDDIPTLTGQ
jgi:hypothetical protein